MGSVIVVGNVAQAAMMQLKRTRRVGAAASFEHSLLKLNLGGLADVMSALKRMGEVMLGKGLCANREMLPRRT